MEVMLWAEGDVGPWTAITTALIGGIVILCGLILRSIIDRWKQKKGCGPICKANPSVYELENRVNLLNERVQSLEKNIAQSLDVFSGKLEDGLNNLTIATDRLTDRKESDHRNIYRLIEENVKQISDLREIVARVDARQDRNDAR